VQELTEKCARLRGQVTMRPTGWSFVEMVPHSLSLSATQPESRPDGVHRDRRTSGRTGAGTSVGRPRRCFRRWQQLGELPAPAGATPQPWAGAEGFGSGSGAANQRRGVRRRVRRSPYLGDVTGEPSSVPRQIAASISGGSSSGRAGVLRPRIKCCEDGKDAGTVSSSLSVHCRAVAIEGSGDAVNKPASHEVRISGNGPTPRP